MMPPLVQMELFPVEEDLDPVAAPDEQKYETQDPKRDPGMEECEEKEDVLAVAPRSELSLDGLDEKQLTRQAREWLEPLYLLELGQRMQVKWNPRLQTTAGRAYYEEDRIELNPLLITLADIAEIERTLKHELAHLVAYERCGKIQRRRIQPHGPEWQEACDDLGIPGEDRCHELELPGRQVRRQYVYGCPACGDQIERVRRYKGHVACYDCCQRYSNGKYDTRFELVEKRL